MKVRLNNEHKIVGYANSSIPNTISKIVTIIYEILSYISEQFTFLFTHMSQRALVVKEDLVSIAIDKALPKSDLFRGGHSQIISSRARIARNRLKFV